MSRAMRLERQLAEAMDHIHTSQPLTDEPATMKQTTPSVTAPSSTAAAPTAGDMEEVESYVLQADMIVCPVQGAGLAVELEEMRALAEDRLRETEVLSQQIVQLKVDLELAQEKSKESCVVSGDITASATYLSLQAQFSIVQQGRARAGG